MNRWVDFRMLKQSVGIEQMLASYRVELKRAGHHQLRGPCPLPTHGSERSRQSFSVDTAKNVWACHSASCCQVRQGRVGGNILDLVALLEGCSIRDAALRLQERRCGRHEAISGDEQQLASKGRSGSSNQFFPGSPRRRTRRRYRATVRSPERIRVSAVHRGFWALPSRHSPVPSDE